jgi:hypothetical protein
MKLTFFLSTSLILFSCLEFNQFSQFVLSYIFFFRTLGTLLDIGTRAISCYVYINFAIWELLRSLYPELPTCSYSPRPVAHLLSVQRVVACLHRRIWIPTTRDCLTLIVSSFLFLFFCKDELRLQFSFIRLSLVDLRELRRHRESPVSHADVARPTTAASPVAGLPLRRR